MKNLLLATTLLLSISAQANNCQITLVKKTEKSKSAYIDGVSVSAKIQKAMESVCIVKVRVMTDEEKRLDKIKSLKKQLNKLGAK